MTTWTPGVAFPSIVSSPPVYRIRVLAKWVAIAVCGLLALVIILIMLAMGGVGFPVSPSEISDQKPYADFLGREYRVVGVVSAYAWNDFPDKATILVITLMSPPGVRNRFVSYVTPLKLGQRVRIVSALRRPLLFGSRRSYVVSVPGAGLPEGIPIEMAVNSDGLPDPRVYEPIDK
jgi:hypothetical protein